MEQEKNSFNVFCERMYRICSEYTKRGFVCSAEVLDPTGMTFHFDIVLNGVKHRMSGCYYGDCHLIAFSDEEFEQWLRELRDGLDWWIRSEKESTRISNWVRRKITNLVENVTKESAKWNRK